MSKKKRDSIKRRKQREAKKQGNTEDTTKKEQLQSDRHKELRVLNTVPKINDEYGVLHSEDEYDQDT